MSELDLTGAHPREWIESLPNYQKATIDALIHAGNDLDAIATIWLSQTGPENNFAFGAASNPQQNIADAVRSELRKLICGDPSYDDLRARIAMDWNKSKLVVVSTIAAVVSGVVGVAAGVLVPVVAVVLAVASEVGTKAWCAASAPPQVQP